MPPSTVTPEIRAAAIADLQAGEQPAIVADRYKLSRDLVNKWKQRMSTPMSTPMSAPVSIRQPAIEAQQQAIGELVIDLLRAKLEASQAIARAANNAAWLERQSAAELALFGEWLDGSAFAIGDRLAGRGRNEDDGAGD